MATNLDNHLAKYLADKLTNQVVQITYSQPDSTRDMLSYMEPKFISIAEAATLTSKSEHNIRRAIKTKLKEEPDTPYIKQEPLANGSQKYLIDSEWLTNHLANSDDKQASANQTMSGEEPNIATLREVINLLRENQEMLREELNEKNKQIASLHERIKEQNMLTAYLQQQLPMIEAPKLTKKHWWNKKTN